MTYNYYGHFRSDLVFSVLFYFCLPILAIATGGLATIDSFGRIKAISLMCLGCAFTVVKYFLEDRYRILRIGIVHGFLVVNIAEAVVHQFGNEVSQGHSYINAIAGVFNCFEVRSSPRCRLSHRFCCQVLMVAYWKGVVRDKEFVKGFVHTTIDDHLR
jgi:hypothetical protein